MPSLINFGPGGYSGGSLIFPPAPPPSDPFLGGSIDPANGGLGPLSPLGVDRIPPQGGGLTAGPSELGPWGYNSRELGQTATPYSQWPAWQRGTFNALLGGFGGLLAGPAVGQAIGFGTDVADARAQGAGWGAALGAAAGGATGVPFLGSAIDWFQGRFGNELEGPPESLAGPAPEEPPKGTIPAPDFGSFGLDFALSGGLNTAGDLHNAWGAAGAWGGNALQDSFLDDWNSSPWGGPY